MKRELERRIAALEASGGQGIAIVVRCDGETDEDAIARQRAENPVSGKIIVISEDDNEL